ncbi:MAG: oxidoreductase [Rhodospirillaceae bacterium]|jgi:acrylyl-CoA reductase (NADPH)|nr:oxidoreductase [Rhodospirillales bacterium]MBT3905626.1 oxidoreductase [Rhodospirillaceae bacterium]MBT4703489.1 oxidoreductase [Rhodospirillaceae bacterium]MBT5034913.1 oxidoreductase [Rhodospirillaceae bacterium]MBT6221682.1 oxidoreductase [Rhodospirillaceae bacterium]
MSETFKALMLQEADKKVTSALEEVKVSDLPAGDVTVDVDYSTLNYKDGMILKGIGRLVRNYPHIPGIDFVGTVANSDSGDYAPGDKVILTGWRVGEIHWGGFATKARVKSDWLVPLPDGLNTKQAMAVGTAGLTSMLAVLALEEHGLSPDQDGEVLVTGAAGGLGSVAVAILAKLGYRVAASTGRAETHDYLKDLGATTIIERTELSELPDRPLLSERWAGCVDAVGSATLTHVLAEMAQGGSVASCGLAGGAELGGTVLPFLLRGVNLLGIDSNLCPFTRRKQAWDRLVSDLDLDRLDAMTKVVSLADLPELADKILAGRIQGRVVVDVAL